MQEDFIYVLPLLTEERRTQVYHVAGGLDLETLDAFFTVYPSLTYQLTEEKAEETPGFFSPTERLPELGCAGRMELCSISP